MIRIACATPAFAQECAPRRAENPPTPDEIRAARKIAERFFKEGMYRKALGQWERVLRGANRDAEAWLGKARCHDQLREFSRSVLACNRALAAQPQSKAAKSLRRRVAAKAQELLGEKLFKEGKFKAALAHWKRVLKIIADDDVAWFYTAACHAKLRELKSAVDAGDQALALRPSWVQAISLRAQMKLLAGDYAGCKKDFDTVIALQRRAGRAPDVRVVQQLEQAQEMLAAAKRVVVGKPAPPIRCFDVKRRSIAITDLVPAEKPPKAVILVFHGGMGSRHDVAQLARLREYLKRLQSTGAKVYCVSRDQPLQNRILAEEKGLPFPMLRDGAGATTKAYGMVDLRTPGKAVGTLLGVAIIDAKRVLRHRQPILDPDGAIDFKALATIAGKITGTPPPAVKGEKEEKETPR